MEVHGKQYSGKATLPKKQQELFGSGKGLPFFQPKLTVNQPGDMYEQEADAVAERVMRMSKTDNLHQPFFVPAITPVQRKCAHCEEEEEERKTLQRKEDSKAEASADSALNTYAGNLSGGQSLPKEVRSFFEPKFGYNFSQVKVHTDSSAAKSAQAINALAYTAGHNIVFNQNQFSPHTESGKHLLAHELTHVVQQQTMPGKSIQRLREEPGACPEYTSGEVSGSHSESGHLAEDVELLGNGRILISDFGIDWRHTRPSLQTNPLLVEWLQRFEDDATYRLNITGYSDCVGVEAGNIHLRQGRAQNVERLLGTSARGRIVFRGMASLGEYIYNNDSVEHRAKNRGVIIEFSRQIDFEDGETIEVEPRNCGPDITSWLITQMNTNTDHPVIRQMREVEWPRYVPFVNLGWTAAALYDFADLVKPGGVWDFKARQGRRGGSWRAGGDRSCPTVNCDQTVTICGHCLNYDVPGNIHFGWVGRAGSLRSWLLHFGADIAQIVSGNFGDDPRDAVAVAIGEAMWDNGAFLCDELESHHDELNLTHTNDCFTCGGQL